MKVVVVSGAVHSFRLLCYRLEVHMSQHIFNIQQIYVMSAPVASVVNKTDKIPALMELMF